MNQHSESLRATPTTAAPGRALDVAQEPLASGARENGNVPVPLAAAAVVRLLVLGFEPALHAVVSRLFPPPASPPVSLDHPQLWQVEAAGTPPEAVRRVQTALADSLPYALVMVDLAGTPAREIVPAIRSLWELDSDLQIILCGESAASRADFIQEIEAADNLVLLKRPFDGTEARLLLRMLAKNRAMAQMARMRSSELSELVAQQTIRLQAANDQLQTESQLRGRIEMELRGSEHRFSLAFKAAAVPMAIMHVPTQTYLEVNDSFSGLTLRSRAEVVGKSPKELGLLVREQDCEHAVEVVRREGRVRDFACRVQPSSGEPRDTLVSLEPVVLGEESCLLVAMLDVTEQRKLEVQLRQSQKMDAIGQLAAGVAHDFNNLLTIIHGHASLQMARRDMDEPMKHSLTQVKLAADRAATLTRQLLAFSRKQVMQLRPLNLNDSIDCSHAMLKRLLGETIRLECDCAPQLPLILADENSVDQVVMNLAVNARDAMPGGGTLRISTREVTVEPADLKRSPEARLGRFVRLSVEDNGSGMDTTVLARIFEPFFTTKAQGKGTGLGLSTVYGIVKQHEGWVQVESAPGLGTKFHVFLAVTDQQPEQVNEASFFPTAADGAKARETVLVVEDEPVLREFITAVLQGQGYIILQAGDGLEALQVCQQTPAVIDLLLTDMIMPNGMSGTKLAIQMLARRKNLKVLYISGYSQELMENASRLTVGTNFLPKPFDVNKLLKAVRCCLEGAAPPTIKTTGLVGVPE